MTAPLRRAIRPLAQHRAAVRGDRLRRPRRHHHQTRRYGDAVLSGPADQDWVEPDLAVAALARGVAGPPEQTDADVNRMFARAMASREYTVGRDRMIEINQLALGYFRSQFRPRGDTDTWPTGSART